MSAMLQNVEAETKRGKFAIVVDSTGLDKMTRKSFLDKARTGTYVVVYHFNYSKELTLHINHYRLNYQKIQKTQDRRKIGRGGCPPGKD